MHPRMIYYVPPDYAEALGWATIGWAQLESAIDILIELGARSGEDAPGRLAAGSRIAALRALSGEDELRLSWREEIGSLAETAARLEADLHNSAHGTIYGRVIDNVAFDIRLLYEKIHPAPVISRMTKAKVEDAAAEMARETRKAIGLAMRMAEALGINLAKEEK